MNQPKEKPPSDEGRLNGEKRQRESKRIHIMRQLTPARQGRVSEALNAL